MKLILSFFLLLLSTSAFAETAYERVMRTGEIRCGYINWPPLQYNDLNSGELKGVWSEYTEALGERLGLKIVWAEELNLSTYLSDLNNGRYDVECGSGWPTAHRGKFVSYLEPAFFVPYNIYVRADGNRFKTFDDLNDENVTMAIMDGENSAMLKNFKFKQANSYEIPGVSQSSALMMAVQTKKADFTALDKLSADAFMKNNPGDVKKFGETVHRISLTFSVARGETALKEMLQTAMDMMQLSGQTDSILNRHDPENKLYIRAAKTYEGQ